MCYRVSEFCKSKKFENAEISDILSEITSTPNIAHKMCITRFSRMIQKDRLLRGIRKSEFREEMFNIPTTKATVTCLKTSKTNDICQNENKFHKCQRMVACLREKNKQLKRKLETRDKSLQEKKIKLMNINNETDQNLKLERKRVSCLKSLHARNIKKSLRISNLQHKLKLKFGELRALTSEKKQLLKEITKLKSCCANDQLKHKMYDEKLKQSETELNDVTKKNQELSSTISYLETLIDDQKPIELFDTVNGTYSNNIVECCINLTNHKVSTKNVRYVIEEVAKLCGKQVKNLPSRTTIDTFVDRKIF